MITKSGGIWVRNSKATIKAETRSECFAALEFAEPNCLWCHRKYESSDPFRGRFDDIAGDAKLFCGQSHGECRVEIGAVREQDFRKLTALRLCGPI